MNRIMKKILLDIKRMIMKLNELIAQNTERLRILKLKV